MNKLAQVEPDQEAAAVEPVAVSDDPAVEALASEIGWRADGELTAAEFIRNGQDIQKRQRVSNESLNMELKAQKDTLHRINSTLDGIQERAMAKARAELQAEKQAAFEGGDYQRFQQIEHAEQSLVPRQAPTQAGGTSPEMNEFVASNTWLKTDPVLRASAIRMDTDIRAANPNLPESEILAKVAAEVKAAYPHKFRTNGGSSPEIDTTAWRETNRRAEKRIWGTAK